MQSCWTCIVVCREGLLCLASASGAPMPCALLLLAAAGCVARPGSARSPSPSCSRCWRGLAPTSPCARSATTHSPVSEPMPAALGPARACKSFCAAPTKAARGRLPSAAQLPTDWPALPLLAVVFKHVRTLDAQLVSATGAPALSTLLSSVTIPQQDFVGGVCQPLLHQFLVAALNPNAISQPAPVIGAACSAVKVSRGWLWHSVVQGGWCRGPSLHVRHQVPSRCSC